MIILKKSLFEGEKERETECKWGKGKERGRQRIPSRLCTISTEPDAGLERMNCEIMT